MDLCSELLAVNARAADAIERGDVAAAAAEFTPGAIVIASDTPDTRGNAAIEALFRSWIDAGMTKERFTDAAAELLGDAALLSCRYEAEMRQDDGSVQFERGRNLQIFKRDESGAWKIHALGISTDST